MVVLYIQYFLLCLGAIIEYLNTLRAVFKFGRRVHFVLRRKMLNPPIARLPAT